MTRPKVVIVGAGFGGLATARRLEHAEVDVTIVDRNNFHTFQPLLYQVATAGLTPGDVAHPVRGIFHHQPNVAFRRGVVRGADLDRKVLFVGEPDQTGDGHPDRSATDELPYDHLVVAAGASTNTFGIDGVDDHGFPLYQLADAVRLRNHVLDRFEATDAEPELAESGSLTFLVIGGGPTGVEVAGALAELFQMVLRRDFPHLDLDNARVILVEMLPELLSPFSPPSQAHAREGLKKRGVDVRTDTAVAQVTPGGIVLDSGEEIPTQTVIWAAGVKANPLGAQLGLSTGKGGRVDVGPHLGVPDHPGVWAIGDVAGIIGRHGPLPQLAPVAIQSGHHVAAQIERIVAGRSPKPFRYRDKGTMATIGRSAAVAELPLGIKLSGFPAWLAWLGLHLVMLAGFRNRISVFVNWAWNYFTWDRGPRLILEAETPGTGDLDEESPTRT